MKYAAVGISTFSIDLVLLFVLTDFFEIQYLASTAIAFLAAVSLNYLFSRRFAFKGTERKPMSGYINFVQIALVGIALTTCFMWLLSVHTELNYFLIRMVIAGIVGMINYFSNLYINFKVAGKYI